MTPDAIRVALETAIGVPEEAMRAVMQQPAALAPAVIAVARAMSDGHLPLPREAWLLRFGLRALAAARETSVCPAFLVLLRQPTLEVNWLFGAEHETDIAQLLLSLFDGDDGAVCAVAAAAGVDDEVRSALMQALARLVWEGRASRERVLALLDRFDLEALVPVDSWAWFGWQEAIMLLGLTEWTERAHRGWEAGRLSSSFGDVDRQDWIEQTRKAAEHPHDPERFAHDRLVPIDDPTADIDWSAGPPSGPGEAPNNDELAWLDTAMLRALPAKNLCLEEADGLLTALAAGPARVPGREYLAEILLAEGETAGFDSPEHRTLVVDLLTRHHDAIERDLAAGKAPKPWIYGISPDYCGALWTRGYLHGVGLRTADWAPLLRDKQHVDTLLAPLFAMQPDPKHGGKSMLPHERRQALIHALPEIALATKAHWQGEWHPLLDAPSPRAVKTGRNDPCPCESGKKYKRCCGIAA
jgi:uncharacterized protein